MSIPLVLSACVGCSSLVGDYAVDAAGGQGGEGGAGVGAMGNFGGQGGTTSTSGSAGGTGGAGGAGGAIGGAGGTYPMLSSRGLLARYYMDEDGPANTVQDEYLDAAIDPLSLPLINKQGMEPDLTTNHRGVRYTSDQVNGMANVPMLGTKLDALSASTRVTVEVVETTEGVSNNARYWMIGTFANEDLSFKRSNSTYVARWTEQGNPAEWVGLPFGDRHICHLVIDTDLPPESRMRLYVDGVEQPILQTANAVGAGESVPIQNGSSFTIGNSPNGSRNIVGSIHYVAVYASALTPAEIANNVSALQLSDDTPDRGE